MALTVASRLPSELLVDLSTRDPMPPDPFPPVDPPVPEPPPEPPFPEPEPLDPPVPPQPEPEPV